MAHSPRADWPIRVVSPSEDSPDLSASTTPEQRLAMVWEPVGAGDAALVGGVFAGLWQYGASALRKFKEVAQRIFR